MLKFCPKTQIYSGVCTNILILYCSVYYTFHLRETTHVRESRSPLYLLIPFPFEITFTSWRLLKDLTSLSFSI